MASNLGEDSFSPQSNQNPNESKSCLCIFCYKSYSGGYSDLNYNFEGGGNGEVVRRFIKILERFSREEIITLSSSSALSILLKAEIEPRLVIGFCEECDIVVKSFSSLYHEFKCLEMELEWKLESLVSIMKLGNRVPSRIRRLNRIFRDDKRDGNEGGCKVLLEDFKVFRHKIIGCCSRRLLQSQPRILLERSSFVGHPEKEVTSSQSCCGDVSDPEPSRHKVASSYQPVTDSFGFSEECDYDSGNMDYDLEGDDVNSNNTPSMFRDSELLSYPSVKSEPEKMDRDNFNYEKTCLETKDSSISSIQQFLREKRKPPYLNLCEHDNFDDEHNVGTSHSEEDSENVASSEDEGRSSTPSKSKVEKGQQLKASMVKRRKDGLEADTDTANYICPITHCAQTFKALLSFEKHKLLHGNFQCEFCDIEMEFAPDLALHEMENHTTKRETSSTAFSYNYNCSRCDLSYQWKNTFISHFVDTHLNLTETYSICEMCNLKFDSKSSFYSHVKTNHNTKGMDPSEIQKCDLCPAYYIKSSQLRVHKYRVHYKGKCPECGKVCSRSQQLETHMSRNHKIRLSKQDSGKTQGNGRKCGMCGMRVPKDGSLEHAQGHVGDYAQPCPNATVSKCSFVATSPWSLRWHLERGPATCRKRNASNRKELICDTCDFRTEELVTLRGHVQRCHERAIEKNFTCPVTDCQSSFCVRQSVWFHLDTHVLKVLKIQKCELCNEKVKVEEIENHLKLNHGIQEVIKCRQCSFMFSSRPALIEHVFDHRQNGMFCDICNDGAKYLRHSELRKHYRSVHQVDKNVIKCEHCSLSFGTRHTLSTHMKLKHSSISVDTALLSVGSRMKKRFSCDICLESVDFIKEESLISHKIKVHGADPFSCKSCGQNFLTAYALSRHEKEHLGTKIVKEFRCEVEGCGMVFTEKKEWRKHTLCHGERYKSYVCETCGKSYSHSSALKYHNEITHLGLLCVTFVEKALFLGLPSKDIS